MIRQREPRITIPALTKLARGQPCMVKIPGVCNRNPETTVWAHSNLGRHGKGVGLKAHDCFGCFACSACHQWLDEGGRRHGYTREMRENQFLLAFEETIKHMWQNGMLTVWTRG